MGLYEVSSGLYAIYLVFEARTFSRASLLDGYWMYTDPLGGQTGPSAVKHCSLSIVWAQMRPLGAIGERKAAVAMLEMTLGMSGMM